MALTGEPAMGMDGKSGLTPRQKRFVEEYLRDPRPKAAALRAGYSERNAAKTAWRLLHEPFVIQALRKAQGERSERLRLSVDRIAQEHARIALADMGRLVSFSKKGPRLRAARAIAPDDSAAVREIVRHRGGFQLKLYEKSRSLEVLTKMLGVVERYRFDGEAALRERAKRKQIQAAFLDMVRRIRERLGIAPDRDVAPIEVVAEAVARGDAEAAWLAQRVGFIPKDERKEPEDDED
jgi:phage terminase small subunit